MDKKSVRPIKVLLPGALVDRVDMALQQGLGGFRTRHGLFEEAIEYYLQELEELQGEQAVLDEPESHKSEHSANRIQDIRASKSAKRQKMAADETTRKSQAPSLAVLARNPTWAKFIRTATSIEEMAICGTNASATIDEKSNVSRPEKGPILGLHNRDWPTLQALDLLAMMTVSGSVPSVDFYNAATANGWQLSDALRAFENKSTGKLSALLPGNQDKAKAAENNYRTFALGWISQSDDGQTVSTSGPLFKWSCAGLTWRNHELHIGLTDSGVALLRGVTGLIPTATHDIEAARFFLAHLANFGQDDWQFLHHLIFELQNRPTRNDLVAIIKELQHSSDSVAASFVQGYVARGREWGLIELKQESKRYVLTPFGKEFVAENDVSSQHAAQRRIS